jgi:hypothetical protein
MWTSIDISSGGAPDSTYLLPLYADACTAMHASQQKAIFLSAFVGCLRSLQLPNFYYEASPTERSGSLNALLFRQLSGLAFVLSPPFRRVQTRSRLQV